MRIASIYIFLLLFVFEGNGQQFFPVKIDNKWGLINGQGRVVVEANYEAIGEFKNFGYAVMQRNGGVGLLGKNAQELISPNFDDLKVLSPSLVAVMKNKEWAVVNLTGQTVLPAGYERVRVCEDRFLAYMRNGKWGAVNLKGQEICSPEYDEIGLFESNFWLTRIGEKYGLLNLSGQRLLYPEHDEIRVFNDNLFFFRNGRKWGLQDDSGQIAAKFDYYQAISDNFIRLKAGSSNWLYSLRTKSIVSRGEYDAFFPFSKQYVIARKRQLLALLDWNGQQILSPYYNEIQTFGNAGFRVNVGGRWGVVSIGDENLVPFDYDYIAPLKNKVCVAKKVGKLGLLNIAGKEIVAPDFTKIEIEDKQAKAYRNEKMTLLNFDENGELTDENDFANHFTIKVQSKQARVRLAWSGETDYVLSDFEWFYSPRVDKWGLRRLSDGGIQIEPTFDNIQVERELGLTVVGVEKLNKLDFDRTTYRYNEVYGLVNNKVGLLVKDMNLYDVRLSDFDEGLPAARCIFADGKHGLINRIGKVIVKDYAFIGKFKDGRARMGIKGKLSGNLRPGKRGLGSLQTYLTRQKSPVQMVDFTTHDREFEADADLICEGCEWGYMDTIGNVEIPPQYDFARDLVNGVGLVQFNGKWGMIAKDAKELLPCEYDDLQFLENTDNSILRVYKSKEKYGLIDTLGQLCVRLDYDEIGSFQEGRLAVKRDGVWGFTDRNGAEVIPCRFREVHDFSEGLASVKIGNKWGFIDENGDIFIDAQYTRAGSFKNSLAPIYTDGGFGYINADNDIIISAEYSNANDFDRGIARVTKDFKHGLIDTLGNFILKPKYLDISSFNEYGLAIVRYGNERVRSGVIDLSGNMRADGFITVAPFKEGRAAVRYKEGYGFIDVNGNVVIKPEYSKVGNFCDGRAMIQKEGQCGYIDLGGNEIVPCIYSKCLDFNDGRAVVYQGYQRGGLIDRNGKVIIEPSVNRLYDFNNGRGLVRGKDRTFIYITEQARLYDGAYEDARKFEHGVATVKINGKWGIINQKGIEVIPPKYDKIESFDEGFARVRIKGFSGLTNLKGDLIVAPNYEYITYAGGGVFRVEQGDKVGYFDMKGEWIWGLKE